MTKKRKITKNKEDKRRNKRRKTKRRGINRNEKKNSNKEINYLLQMLHMKEREKNSVSQTERK